ncbi:LamG-like jellyroll fold domain-containing protein [Geminisphaera colitermitum]|uniref:LamG-like jellyroll fold domain-containing protein n=1 Tax=Geminisphaera colitermitum TaxID=1148786 RepID=UPI0005B7DCB1|nr:LamG-like jellyroll fold domain-containing protein [Geminisphaera colitermitum]
MKSRAQTLLHKTTIQRPVTTLTALAGFLSLTLLALSTAATSHAQVLLYEFNPATPGTSAASTGTVTSATGTLYKAASTAANLYGADGSGVSGLPGDKAFNNTATTHSTSNVTSGLFSVGGGVVGPTLAGLTQFTLAGWFKTDSNPIAGGARLFEYTSGNNGFLFYSSSNGSLSLSINGANIATSNTTSYTAVGSWVFFAVSIDLADSTKTVTFYQGTDTTLATPTADTTINATNLNKTTSVAATTANLNIGNSGNFARAMDGYLDNMAIFTTALTEAEVRAFQIRGAPQLVPEPATNALALAAAAATLGCFAALRRRHHDKR